MSLDHSPAAANEVPSTGADDLAPLECREVLGSLWERLDGGCSPDLAGRFDAHLSRCPTCSNHRRFQQRLVAALGALRGRSFAPARLHDRVRRALAAERRQYRPR